MDKNSTNSSNSAFVVFAAKYDSHVTLIDFVLFFSIDIVAWYASNGNPETAIYEKYSFGFQPTTCSSTFEPSSNEIKRLAPTPVFFSPKNFVDFWPSNQSNFAI